MKRWIILLLMAAAAFALGTLLARTFMTVTVSTPPAAPSNTAIAGAPAMQRNDGATTPASSPQSSAGAGVATNLTGAERGKALFDKGCSGCHSVGGGDKVGPDLAGVAKRRTHEWLIRMITLPDRLRLEQDPIAIELFAKYNRVPMPNLGLSPDDAAAILIHIASATDGVSVPARP